MRFHNDRRNDNLLTLADRFVEQPHGVQVLNGLHLDVLHVHDLELTQGFNGAVREALDDSADAARDRGQLVGLCRRAQLCRAPPRLID